MLAGPSFSMHKMGGHAVIAELANAIEIVDSVILDFVKTFDVQHDPIA